MNNRINEVRKALGLTQEKFADRLGLTRNFVWMIEKGERVPSDRTVSDICQKFHVSYDWLMTGAGEMFEDLPETAIDDLASIYQLDDMDKKIISAYLALNEHERETIKRYIKSVMDK